MPPDHIQPSHVDVLIVGAGLSGIGAACHLRRRCPGKTVAIKQGPSAPWRLYQSYPRDAYLLRHGPLTDPGMRFTRVPPGAHGARVG